MSNSEKMRITIVEASADDAEAICALQHQLAAYEQQPSALTPQAVRAVLDGRQSPKGECLLAKKGPDAIGFIFFYPGYDLSSATYGYHLGDIFVVSAYRHQRIGRQLLSALAKRAVEENRNWISLTALDSNHAAKAFYRRNGFRKMDVSFFAIGANAIARLAAL